MESVVQDPPRATLSKTPNPPGAQKARMILGKVDRPKVHSYAFVCIALLTRPQIIDHGDLPNYKNGTQTTDQSSTSFEYHTVRLASQEDPHGLPLQAQLAQAPQHRPSSDSHHHHSTMN